MLQNKYGLGSKKVEEEELSDVEEGEDTSSEEEEDIIPQPKKVVKEAEPVKRGRGRPKKVKEVVEPEKPIIPVEDEETTRKPRGIRKQSNVQYTALIDGKEKTYKYYNTYLRNKFISVQRDYYKMQCRKCRVDYIGDMFTQLAGHYWKMVGKKLDEETLTSEPIDLCQYYRDLREHEKVGLFAGKTHYINLVNKMNDATDNGA